MSRERKIKLSCIMLARNLISQGYPFVEAILSVIPYCEEMIICEGYSDDGTYEVLKKLVEVYEDKIIIKRKKWRGKKDLGELFAQILNEAMEESSGDYILKIDPDHVFDKETIEELIFLARMYPKVKIFYLPYLYFVGNWIIKPEIWAPLFSKNNEYIKLGGDSGGFIFTPLGIVKIALRNITHPLRALKSIHYAYVPKPVYHYYALFPGNYLTRIEEHKKFYKKYDWSPYDKILTKLKEIMDWNKFWEIVAKEIVEKAWTWYGNRKVIKYTGSPPQPSIMKPLWGLWEYKVREELISSKMIDHV
ncbi:glycosyltransferase family 2 protein [Methanocaldococcus sp. 28A]